MTVTILRFGAVMTVHLLGEYSHADGMNADVERIAQTGKFMSFRIEPRKPERGPVSRGVDVCVDISRANLIV